STSSSLSSERGISKGPWGSRSMASLQTVGDDGAGDVDAKRTFDAAQAGAGIHFGDLGAVPGLEEVDAGYVEADGPSRADRLLGIGGREIQPLATAAAVEVRAEL